MEFGSKCVTSKWRTASSYSDDGESILSESDDPDYDDESVLLLQKPKDQVSPPITIVFLLLQWTQLLLRPSQASLTFLSWTPPVLPLVGLLGSSASDILSDLQQVYDGGIGTSWDNITTVHESASLGFDWLDRTELTPLDKFDGFRFNKTTYNAQFDPLRATNLDQPLLAPLRDTIKDVKIKHILVFILESTSKDLFPFKKNNTVYRFITESYGEQSPPNEVQDFLANFTSNANSVTGDYDDGFPHSAQPKRGGVNFDNAWTTSSYTIKSVEGTLCGITPLAADFNHDHLFHRYQPCLPQILDLLQRAEDGEPKTMRRVNAASSWKSSYIQSVVSAFDSYKQLLVKIGFPEKNQVNLEYLISEEARFGQVTRDQDFYFGFGEDEVEKYLRDEFVQAKKNQRRAFVTHLTATTHHPWILGSKATIDPVHVGNTGGTLGDEISRYINTIAWGDQWLAQVLDMLDQEGVADETLVVIQGDHGIPLLEGGGSTYNKAQDNVMRVPLVLSHPKLPAFSVQDYVSTNQVAPTVLDLLLETESLSAEASKVARDLLGNFEGQSLIRPQVTPERDGMRGRWQISIVSPGSYLIMLRDVTRSHLRIVVPIAKNGEWRLLDVRSEAKDAGVVVMAFEFRTFLTKVEVAYGVDVAKWVENGAFVARWWIQDHYKRWRYGVHEN